MHILFLTQIIPYPPDAGPRVKTWHVLRYLASRGHRVTLASFVRPEEEPYVSVVRQMCDAVYTVPIHRSRPADVGYWLRSNLTGRPFLIERDDLAEMRSLVGRLVIEEAIDVIHADQLGMTQFALPYSTHLAKPQGSNRQGPKVIFDAHNAVWTIVERMRQNAPWFLKLPATVEARRIKRYEGNVVKNFDSTLAVTEPDRKALLEAVEVKEGITRDSIDSDSKIKSISVIPIAVDTKQLQPAHRQPDSYNIVTLGTLHYPPNADGIRWFMQEVFPKVCQEVPQAQLTIIGKNPPADFLQYAAQHSQAIKVTGYVQDLAPYMDQAALMVVAVRAGGGMRVRILEAFARAMPVVTTTVGLEGIQAQPGEEVLVADTPEAFAHEVIRLLQDPALQARLAENGRRLAEACYDWQVVLTKMDEVYGQAEKETIPEK